MSIPKIAAYPMPTSERFSKRNRVEWSIDPSRAVLLVHDMQDYFLSFYAEDSKLIEQLKSNISTLRLWAKEREVPIVYTAQPHQQPTAKRGLLVDMWGGGITEAAKDLTQINLEVAPDSEDIILEKWRYSAFRHTDLERMMIDRKRDQLLICGVYSHIGCYSTAMDAFMLNIQPFMIADALADFSEQDHLQSLALVADCCGSVVGVKQVLLAEAGIFSRRALCIRLSKIIGLEEFQPGSDENLLDYGIDSMQIMSLIEEWSRSGIRVSLEALLREPTLEGWYGVLESAVREREFVSRSSGL